MRRFTTVSITMLAGIAVGGPACGSIIGIDSDKQLFPDAGASSSGEAGPAPTGTTPVDGGSDTGPIDAKTCSIQNCSFANGTPFPTPGKCDVATNTCTRDCAGLCAKTQECPPNLNCKIVCKGDSCRDVHCKGGASCTFDCTEGNCEGAICESTQCIFLCGQGNACDKAGCGGANVDCQQQCSTPGQPTKECKDGLLCCDGRTGGGDDDDDLHPPPGVTRNCPAKSQCPD